MVDIYDKAAGKVADHLAKATGWKKTSDDYQSMKYGIDALMRNCVSVALLLIIGYVLGIFSHVALFMLTFGALRSVSFGAHAPNPLVCTIYGIIRTIGGAILALSMTNMLPAASLLITLAIDFVAVYCFWRYAPAETKKRPIPPGQRKRFARLSKISVIGVIVLRLILLKFSLSAYANTIAIATLAQAINLCPFMFRLFEKKQIS